MSQEMLRGCVCHSTTSDKNSSNTEKFIVSKFAPPPLPQQKGGERNNSTFLIFLRMYAPQTNTIRIINMNFGMFF